MSWEIRKHFYSVVGQVHFLWKKVLRISDFNLTVRNSTAKPGKTHAIYSLILQIKIRKSTYVLLWGVAFIIIIQVKTYGITAEEL